MVELMQEVQKVCNGVVDACILHRTAISILNMEVSRGPDLVRFHCIHGRDNARSTESV